MKQPCLGAVSSVLVILVSFLFISIFALSAFTTWVADAMICCIPMIIVIGVTWGTMRPAFAAGRPQPARGLLFLLPALAAGILVAPFHFVAVGGGVSPPVPMLSMCIVTTVVITFWLAIIWGGWPFTALAKSPIAAGLWMLAASYALNLLFFRLFFDYGFMRRSPAYVVALDPHGLFDAWSAQVFYVTALSGMFLMLNFELWPLSRRPVLMRQPLLGAIWTASVLGIGTIVFFIGMGLVRMDPPLFMVRVPIPFIFGTIIVMNMMRNTLFARFAQPLRGLLNSTAAALIGVGLSRAYAALAPLVSGNMESGPPGYVSEIWLASALLAVTFPFLIVFADLFRFWPLRRDGKEE